MSDETIFRCFQHPEKRTAVRGYTDQRMRNLYGTVYSRKCDVNPGAEVKTIVRMRYIASAVHMFNTYVYTYVRIIKY